LRFRFSLFGQEKREMADNFLHGISLEELDSGAVPITQTRSSIIGIVGTASKGIANKPYLIRSEKEAVEAFGEANGGTDTLPRALGAIYAQGKPLVIAIKVEAGTAKAVEASLNNAGDRAATLRVRGVDYAVTEADLYPSYVITLDNDNPGMTYKAKFTVGSDSQEVSIAAPDKPALRALPRNFKTAIEALAFGDKKLRVKLEQNALVVQGAFDFSVDQVPSENYANVQVEESRKTVYSRLSELLSAAGITAKAEEAKLTIFSVSAQEVSGDAFTFKEADAGSAGGYLSVLGGYDAAQGRYTGIKLLQNIESEPVGTDKDGNPVFLPFAPKILIAPDFSGEKLVADALILAARSLRGVAIIDIKAQTKEEAAASAAGFDAGHGYGVWPPVNMGPKIGDIGLSAPAAGLVAVTDDAKGFWVSPSNRVMLGIVRLTKQVSFSISDRDSDANFLNNNKIATVVRADGFRLWGNRTLAGPSEIRFKWINVRRIANSVNDSIIKNHLYAVDQNITVNYISTVLGGVNSYMRSLQTRGAILGGTAFADPELNSKEDIKNAIVTFDFEFTPTYVANEIRFRSRLTDRFISDLFT
jgi:phage tail sheath protein FI